MPLTTLCAKADALMNSMQQLIIMSFGKEYNPGLFDKTGRLPFGKVMFITDLLFWLEKNNCF
jgi:hypothetical protein